MTTWEEMRLTFKILGALGGLLGASACSGAPACVPGSTQACVAPGCSGTQVCASDGQRFDTCLCAPDAGGAADAGFATDGGTDASVSPADAGYRDGGSDAGVERDASVVVEAELARFRWAERAPAHAPPNRTSATLVYVPELGGVVLIGGGLDSGEYPGDAWLWDGNDWTLLARPPFASRAGHLSAYDETQHQLVVFGGLAAPDSGLLSDPADTWVLRNGQWTQPPSGPYPPPPMSYGGMAYDVRERGVMALGGLRTSGAANVARVLLDGGWGARTPLSVERWAHAAVTLPSEGGVALFGGITLGRYSSELLLYSGAGERVLERDGQDAGPTPRETPSAAELRSLNGLLVFGGYDMSVGARADTWFWSAPTRWVELRSDGGTNPPARSRAASAFDVARSCFVVFGGQGTTGDTWELCRQ